MFPIRRSVLVVQSKNRTLATPKRLPNKNGFFLNSSNNNSALVVLGDSGGKRCFSRGRGMIGARRTSRKGLVPRPQQLQRQGNVFERGGENKKRTWSDWLFNGYMDSTAASLFFCFLVAGMVYYAGDTFIEDRRKRNVGIAQAQLAEELGVDCLTQLSGVARFATDDPALFRCVVRRVDPLVPGLTLPGLEIGDVVEVVRECIGPEERFNLCRTIPESPKDPVAVGVVPLDCLQPMEDYRSSETTAITARDDVSKNVRGLFNQK